MHRLNHLYLVRQYAFMLVACFLASLLFTLGGSEKLFEFDAILSLFLWISAMWWLMTSPQETKKSNWYLATLPLDRKNIHRSRYYCSMICICLMLGSFLIITMLLTLAGSMAEVDVAWVVARVLFSLAVFSLIFAVTLASDSAVLRIIFTLVGGMICMFAQQQGLGNYLLELVVGTLLIMLISVFILRYGERRFVQMDLV